MGDRDTEAGPRNGGTTPAAAAPQHLHPPEPGNPPTPGFIPLSFWGILKPGYTPFRGGMEKNNASKIAQTSSSILGYPSHNGIGQK